MTARTKHLRRRVPVKRSSEEVVDAILAAAALLIAERGIDAFTTNHVAERAGVSVGSLYRYFARKEAIVAELDLRNRKANAERMMQFIADFEQDFPKALRDVLRVFVDVEGPNATIRRTLMREVPPRWIQDSAAATWHAVLTATSSALHRLRPDLPLEEARRRTFIALHAVQGVAFGHLLWPLDGFEDSVEQLERMLLPFLLAPAKSAPL